MVLKYRLLIALLFLVLACDIKASTLDSLRLEKYKNSIAVVHKVEKGETLYSLSKRYNAEIDQIIKASKLSDNSISLGQILIIPISKMKEIRSVKTEKSTINGDIETEKTIGDTITYVEEVPPHSIHVVKAKETFYSISKQYGISIDELKQSNGIEGDVLSLGQELIIRSDAAKERVSISTDSATVQKDRLISQGFKEYFVQNGDVLASIARKYQVRPDSILVWNQLSNSYLAIGQKLIIKGEIDSLAQMVKPKVEATGYSNKTKIIDSSGFTRIVEDGIAKSIEGVSETEKYLALHRSLSVGTMIEVRNLMNNKKIFVRVVGKLPATNLNENTLIRLTPICFEKLGIIDPKSRVEISYYED